MSKRHAKQKHQLRTGGGKATRSYQGATPWGNRHQQDREAKQDMAVRAALAHTTRELTRLHALFNLLA